MHSANTVQIVTYPFHCVCTVPANSLIYRRNIIHDKICERFAKLKIHIQLEVGYMDKSDPFCVDRLSLNIRT